MVGFTQRLEKLGFPLGQKLATDFILASLPPSMLKTAESDIKKSTGSGHVMAVQNKPNFKKNGTSWTKGKAKVENPAPNPDPKAKTGPAADTKCFHYHEKVHWKRNCKVYLASLKNRGSKSTSKSGTLTVYVMDILIADSFINSWVLDTGSVAHICNSM
jgi:hypothetical protein